MIDDLVPYPGVHFYVGSNRVSCLDFWFVIWCCVTPGRYGHEHGSYAKGNEEREFFHFLILVVKDAVQELLWS
jgi:hypothetical protein